MAFHTLACVETLYLSLKLENEVICGSQHPNFILSDSQPNIVKTTQTFNTLKDHPSLQQCTCVQSDVLLQEIFSCELFAAEAAVPLFCLLARLGGLCCI